MCSAFGSWLVSRLLTGYKVAFLFWSKFDWIRSRGRLWLIVWNLLPHNDSLDLSFDVLCILAQPYQYHNSDAVVRELPRLKELQWEVGKNIPSSSTPCVIHLDKGCWRTQILTLRNLRRDWNSINTAQLTDLHCSHLCEAFCFRRSEWIRGEGGATVGVGWVSLRLLDKVFLWSERCTLVWVMLCDCQIWGTTGRFQSFCIILSSISHHPMLMLGREMTLLLEHEIIKKSW